MTKLPLFLTLAGAVPFVGLSMAVSLRWFADNHMVIELLLTYSAVILSFLGGIHWGVAVGQYAEHKKLASLMIAESVVLPLIAWAVIFHADVHMQFLILTSVFTCVWGVDSFLHNRSLIPTWFFELRCIITPIVVVSLYVAYFGII